MPVVPPEHTDDEQTTGRPSSILNFLWETLQTLALALILFFVIDAVVARVYVENVSMLPTLHPGEFLLVNKFAYTWGGEMKRGDIIVFHHAPDPDYIKRLIGLPGDDVKMDHGQLYINGQRIEENYTTVPATYSGEWQVPENMIFALGDNRDQSSDSHKWGFVPTANLVGKAFLVYWPLNKIQVLDDTILLNQ
ncbi:MAG: signal peptidase I [Anaerolineae bacterium]|nr:signal peptidase I [Anaerolineae bacterium]